MVVLAIVLAGALPTTAAEPSLVCFGSEPSWSVALTEPDSARLTVPGAPAAEYRGASSRIDALHERIWRGAPTSGSGADLVVFLREGECSDGMSDTTYPVVARVSHPDGRFFAGCCRLAAAGAAAAPVAAEPAAPAAIEGPVWRLTSLRGLDDATLAAVPQGVSVRFEGGQLQGFGGCNPLVGSYAVAGDTVTIAALAGTMKACPAPVMAVEDAFKKALAGTLAFTVTDGRLTLTGAGDETPVLAFAAAPPPRLDDTTWDVTGFNNGRHALVSPLRDTALSLVFQGGSVAGSAGCNTFRATYARDGSQLTIGPATTTRKVCDGAGVMQQEREFLAALGSATTWAIDRDLLELRGADGERVLLARRRAS